MASQPRGRGLTLIPACLCAFALPSIIALADSFPDPLFFPLTSPHSPLSYTLVPCLLSVWVLPPLTPSNPSLLSPCTSLRWPSVPAPVLFHPLPQLSWTPSHTITASPSLPLSFKHISLGAIHPTNTFYGLNPFSHCVFTGLGAGIDLALFVSPITRFLSHLLLLCFLLVASLMAHHIHCFSFFIYLLYTLFFHLPISFPLNLWIMHCVSLCVFVSLFSNPLFSSDTPLHPLPPLSSS